MVFLRAVSSSTNVQRLTSVENSLHTKSEICCRAVLEHCPSTQRSGWRSCSPESSAFWVTWRHQRHAATMLQFRAMQLPQPQTLLPSCWRATACSGTSATHAPSCQTALCGQVIGTATHQPVDHAQTQMTHEGQSATQSGLTR